MMHRLSYVIENSFDRFRTLKIAHVLDLLHSLSHLNMLTFKNNFSLIDCLKA
ncbi:hypothetical protein HanRHA438_Chr09g0382081 [Helianthus annuus]|nr:hypothetical protein HanRHA438_Chr09g0382081 [Helianthus annuus]